MIIAVVATLAELFFGDLIEKDESTEEKTGLFTNNKGEGLTLSEIIKLRKIKACSVSYLIKRKPVCGFLGKIGFKETTQEEKVARIRNGEIRVSSWVNDDTLRISIKSTNALPGLHKDYDKGTICLKYYEEDEFYWHIYVPIDSFVPEDWE